MYTIKVDDKILYHPMLEERSVLSPKLTLETNKAGSLTLLIPPTNTAYDQIQKMKSIVEVYNNAKKIFRGRVLDADYDFYNRKNIYCEGELSFLLDSIQRPYVFTGSPEEIFHRLIENHNSQVDSSKQFKIGRITVTDPNDYLRRECQDYTSTYDVIREKLLEPLGGYINFRDEGENRVIDYLAEPETSNQIIQFGENLLDLKKYITAKDVFTVLIPLGSKAEETEERLTVSSVNSGKDYIENQTGISLFGRIWKTENWDDVTIPENLLKKGTEYLNKGIEMAVSLNIKAVDLNLINVTADLIKPGQLIRVLSIPHKIDSYFQCDKVTIDLQAPDQSSYEFGKNYTTLTEKQMQDSNLFSGTFIDVKGAAHAAESAMKSAEAAQKSAESSQNIVSKIEGDYVSSSTFNLYKEEIVKKIASVYHYKGNKPTKEDLPKENNQIGDVYNILDTGANYAWSDQGWDKLSEDIDLSGYTTLTEFKKLEERVKKIEGGIQNGGENNH